MRALSAEEAALWERVTREVQEFHARPEAPMVPEAPAPPAQRATRGAAARTRVPAAPPKPRPGTTLDGTWDRRLLRGDATPDLVIDFHGHDLNSAYQALDTGLTRARASGARLVLLITGRPQTDTGPGKRGAIRAAVGDWLHGSPHAAGIAAVRSAAPRHGGAGALYIVLRRGG